MAQAQLQARAPINAKTANRKARKPQTLKALTQRAQYPLIKEYGLNYIGLHIMIEAIFLLYWALWGALESETAKAPKSSTPTLKAWVCSLQEA